MKQSVVLQDEGQVGPTQPPHINGTVLISTVVVPGDIGPAIWRNGHRRGPRRGPVVADASAAGRTSPHLFPTAPVPAPHIDFIVPFTIVTPGDVGPAVRRNGHRRVNRETAVIADAARAGRVCPYFVPVPSRDRAGSQGHPAQAPAVPG